MGLRSYSQILKTLGSQLQELQFYWLLLFFINEVTEEALRNQRSYSESICPDARTHLGFCS